MKLKKLSGLHLTATERKHIVLLVEKHGHEALVTKIRELEANANTNLECFWPIGRKGYKFTDRVGNVLDVTIFDLKKGRPTRSSTATVRVWEEEFSAENVDMPIDLRPAGMRKGMGNCGVVATAVVLDQPYAEVERRFRNLCGKDDRWKGGTSWRDRGIVVESFDHKHVRVTGLGRKMVATTCAKLDPNKRYIVRTGGHAMAFVNGYLVDQAGTWDIEHPKYRRRIVSYVFEVVPE